MQKSAQISAYSQCRQKPDSIGEVVALATGVSDRPLFSRRGISESTFAASSARSLRAGLETIVRQEPLNFAETFDNLKQCNALTLLWLATPSEPRISLTTSERRSRMLWSAVESPNSVSIKSIRAIRSLAGSVAPTGTL